MPCLNSRATLLIILSLNSAAGDLGLLSTASSFVRVNLCSPKKISGIRPHQPLLCIQLTCAQNYILNYKFNLTPNSIKWTNHNQQFSISELSHPPLFSSPMHLLWIFAGHKVLEGGHPRGQFHHFQLFLPPAKFKTAISILDFFMKRTSYSNYYNLYHCDQLPWL